MNRRLTICAAVAATLVAAFPAGAQNAGPSIEGVWARSATSDGRTLVEAVGPNAFRGTVVRGSAPNRCRPDADGFVHPFGATVWNATANGATYAGTVVYFDARCHVLGKGQATWTATQGPAGPALRLCANRPGGGPPTVDPSGKPTATTSCADLVRIAAPRPPPTFAAAVAMPSTSHCADPRAFVIRLVNRSNDPFRAMKVSVNGAVRRRVSGAPLTGTIVLHRLPRKRLSLRVVATTATGLKLVGVRSYRACPAG